MGDLETIARIVLRQKDVLFLLLIGVLILSPAAALTASRVNWPRSRVALAACAGACLALIPATTLPRGHLLIRWNLDCIVTHASLSTSPEAVLNMLLFAPAAFFGVLALQRITPVIVAAAACSAAIEIVQHVADLGTCETDDVVRNVVGAGAAAALAALARRAVFAIEGRVRARQAA